MSDHPHYGLDVLAIGTAWVSASVTLAGIQSMTAIVASCLSGVYFIIRISTDPAVRRWLRKILPP